MKCCRPLALTRGNLGAVEACGRRRGADDVGVQDGVEPTRVLGLRSVHVSRLLGHNFRQQPLALARVDVGSVENRDALGA